MSFGIAQLNRNKQRRSAWAVDAALLVMAHGLVERRQRCVVHIRRSQRHRPQRWGLESEVQRLVLGHLAAAVVGRGRADIVKLVVGEPPSVVAGSAGSLAIEQRKAALGGGTDRPLVS